MKNAIILLALVYLFFIQSCQPDESEYFTIESSTIEASEYHWGNSLKFLYFTDELAYAGSLDRIRTGAKIRVRVFTADERYPLTADNFEFDWSSSSPTPVNYNDAQAEFIVTANLNIHVKITDRLELVAGKNYGFIDKIDKVSGVHNSFLTPRFNDQAALFGMKAFVYHPGKHLYYASVQGYTSGSSILGGDLYTIDPITKVATRINDNTGNNGLYNQWKNIFSWVVDTDDSLVAIGDFGLDGKGIAKFGPDGRRARTIHNFEICCGTAIAWSQTRNLLVTSAGTGTNPGEVELQYVTRGGIIAGSVKINRFQDFPLPISGSTLRLTQLAADQDGTFYGIMHHDQYNFDLFVKVDLQTESIYYISTLNDALGGPSYNSLTFVPKHLFAY
jgi:hypothetical protein